MKRSIGLLIGLLFAATFFTYAQNSATKEVAPIRFSDITWYDKGFDFHIGAGMFFGHKFNANYYNGSNLNEGNLNYVFESRDYWYREIMDEISTAYPYISNTDNVHPSVDPGGDYNWESRYNLSTLISLGVRYKIRNGWGLSLSYSFSRMNVSSQCLLETSNDYGNMRKLPVMKLLGKEDRSMIDLSISYLFSSVHPIAKPFIELGAQFNYAKVKSFRAVLLDQDNRPVGSEYDLLDYYNGDGYYPGAQSYDIIFGGPGFGFSGAAGLKIVVNKNVSLDPTFYCTVGRTAIYQMKNSPLPEYDSGNQFTFNYGVMVRIVMNDFFISKNR